MSAPQASAERVLHGDPDDAGVVDRARRVELTVVVPVTGNPANVAAIYEEYAPALAGVRGLVEFVFSIEPGGRSHVRDLQPLIDRGEPVRVVQAGRVGEANLLRAASERSSSDLILTLPAYRRVEAAALPDLLRAIEGGADLVVARRWPRSDGVLSRLSNRVFNSIVRRFVGPAANDIASGVQAMRRKVIEGTPLYGDFFRFLPVLAGRAGFVVVEVDAAQHPADRRRKLPRPWTYAERLIDLAGLFFLTRFTERPLRFFGLFGGGLAAVGGVMLAVLLFQRMFAGQGLSGRPIVLVAIIAFTLGIQTIALGLIGEMIVHLHASRGRRYRLSDPEREP